MSTRKRFRMSDEDMKRIMNIARSYRPVMYTSGGIEMFESKQEAANRVWKEMGARLGFQWDTAENAGTGDLHDFTAVAVETAEEKEARAREARAARIAELRAELNRLESEQTPTS